MIVQMHDIDLIDTNVLIAGLLRRKQDTVTSLLALLETMALISSSFPKQERYVISDILRSKADQIERAK